MRLPAKDGHQQRTEDARQLHEDLYRAFLDPTVGRVFLASAHAGLDLVKLSGNLHRFWMQRGFRLRCKTVKDKTGFHVWIERGAVTRRPKAQKAEAA